jgi:serine/threonine protein kinase
LLESRENIEKYFGTPETTPLRVVRGFSPPYSAPHVPRYVVYSPDQSPFLEAIFDTPSLVQLKICDFSEASLHDPARPEGAKRKLNCPNVHAAPEVIFDELVSPASDMWALGNTMHQILTGGGTEGATVIPGAPGCPKDEVVSEMVRLLGRLPDRWWTRWEARSKYFDEAGKCIGDIKANRTAEPLGSRISAVYLPTDQKRAFQKVLAGIFVYEPQDRLTAGDVVRELAYLEEKQHIPPVASHNK